ncbi:MAG: S8 family serine peptidase [Anaerolineae bacterium]
MVPHHRRPGAAHAACRSTGSGHGTHVTGIALAGDGYGVAPGARWIAVRACAGTRCDELVVLQGLERLLELGDRRPDVLNASLTSAADTALIFESVLSNA